MCRSDLHLYQADWIGLRLTWIKLRAVWIRFRANSLMCRPVAIEGRAGWIASWEDWTHRREV
jgi:hypothetical protein